MGSQMLETATGLDVDAQGYAVLNHGMPTTGRKVGIGADDLEMHLRSCPREIHTGGRLLGGAEKAMINR